MKKVSFILLLISLLATQLQAQLSTKVLLEKYQDSLISLRYQSINDSVSINRYHANYQLIKTMVNALKTKGSYQFNFDSLKTISILRSPDNKFRIFTWNVMNNDGSYRFYGAIQLNSSTDLKMLPLVDHSPFITHPQDTTMTNDTWYGCQYYKIIPVINSTRQPYYVLLGWKGNNVKTTKKLIEILYFRNNKAYFGLPVFEGNKEFAGKNRIVFEYTRQASMMLNYLPQEGMIVYDHLSSSDTKKPLQAEFMGPDMSYDGFKLINGKWKYVADLPLKNPTTGNEDHYNNPSKSIKNINKLKP